MSFYCGLTWHSPHLNGIDKQLGIQIWFKMDVYHFQGTKYFQIELIEHTFISKHY